MAGKGGKSGKGSGPGKRGVRVEKRGVGKKGLVEDDGEVWEVRGTLIGEGRALIGGEEEGWEVVEGLKREGEFWTNGVIKIRCGKKGLEESGWKVWEDETMVDTFEGKVIKKEKVEEERGMGEDMEVDEEEEFGSVEGEMERKEEGRKGKEVPVEVVSISSGSEEGNGVGLMEEWKEEKRAKDKRLRDEGKKREKEGMVNRGKDRGMGRSEVLEMKRGFEYYEEIVSDVEYVLGIDKGLARCFVMDREVRKVIDMMVSGDSDNRVDVRRMNERKEEVEVRVEVRSEVVLEVCQKEREDLKREVGTKGGRTYGEVSRGVGSGIAEGKEVVEKMEEKRMKWVENSMEREKRNGRVVEMVMDSQEEKSGKE